MLFPAAMRRLSKVRTRRIRRLVPRLLLAAASLLAVLALCELGVRVFTAGRYGRRPPVFGPDPQTVFATTPGIDDVFHGSDYSTAIRTDAFGCRLGELGEVPADVEAVLLSGDSYTFGWGVSTADTGASRFDRLLWDGSGKTTRAINLGVGGFGTLQSALRLAAYLRRHPDLKLRALVFTHCHNDVTDNTDPERLGVLSGTMATFALPVRNPSRSQLWNLLRRTYLDLRQHRNRDLDASFGFGVRRLQTASPEEFEIAGVTVHRRELVPASTAERVTHRRRSFTDLQRRLLAASIELLHRAVRDRGIRVYHTFIRTVPEYYLRAVSALIAAAPAYGNEIVNLGRVPVQDDFHGEIVNRHSGAHFTPEFNRVWAERMYQILRDGDPNLHLR